MRESWSDYFVIQETAMGRFNNTYVFFYDYLNPIT
jgi:hypothetical protein